MDIPLRRDISRAAELPHVNVTVVDTNVISEMMRDNPVQAVLAWTAAVGGLHTTAITPTVNRAVSGERHELSVPHRKVQP